MLFPTTASTRDGTDHASRVVVVIPTYNEADNLPRLVEAMRSLELPALRMLIVDDASPDGTGAVADALAEHFPTNVAVLHRPSKQGIGTAYRTGFLWALERGAQVVFEMDADLSHDPLVLPQFLQAIQEADVVIGSRYMEGSCIDTQWAPWRLWLSHWGNQYARWVTGVPVRDATSGYRCYRANVLQSIDLSRIRSEGYAFQVEMATACHYHGFQVREIPITFTERTAGKSKMSWRIVWEAVWRTWQFRLRYGLRPAPDASFANRARRDASPGPEDTGAVPPPARPTSKRSRGG